jgi:excisionase family DNA binding protein
MIAMMKDDTGRKMLSCREAAQKYGCSMRYIRKLAKDGEIRSETVAGSYMVAEADVASRKAKVAKGKGRHKPKASKFRPG